MDLAFATGVGPEAVGAGGLLVTALLLGIRHGIDWDHIAAIADITGTTAVGTAADTAHALEHRTALEHDHPHGGRAELEAHAGLPPGAGPGAMVAVAGPAGAVVTPGFLGLQRQPLVLGTLYALGHAVVVALLGLAALAFGAYLPEWIDPIMSRLVGFTLVILGVWVLVSLWRYARHGTDFRLRSRWMLAFDGVRYAWRRFEARVHGHEHVRPLEMSSYGPRTAVAVGMIHGIGAETGTQVLLIAAIGGATAAGLGVPMMLAFILGLLVSNSLIVVVSSTGFLASQLRRRIYLVVGLLAAVFSLAVGLAFLFEAERVLPDLDSLLSFIGG